MQLREWGLGVYHSTAKFGAQQIVVFLYILQLVTAIPWQKDTMVSKVS